MMMNILTTLSMGTMLSVFHVPMVGNRPLAIFKIKI